MDTKVTRLPLQVGTFDLRDIESVLGGVFACHRASVDGPWGRHPARHCCRRSAL